MSFLSNRAPRIGWEWTPSRDEILPRDELQHTGVGAERGIQSLQV